MLPVALVVVALVGAMGCGGGGAAAGLDYPGSADGAKALVGDLLVAADKPAMIGKLKPTKADLEALFDASVVDAMSAHVDKMYASIGEVGAKEGQTEVLFNTATAEDFKADAEPAKKFPGGYARIADKLQPAITWYAWKYVKPGETIGMAYDGLAHVNGRWVWVPKPFRALAPAN